MNTQTHRNLEPGDLDSLIEYLKHHRNLAYLLSAVEWGGRVIRLMIHN